MEYDVARGHPVFARFIRTRETSSRMLLVAILGGIIVSGWALWFFLARVALFENSHDARLEVEEAPHDVDAPVTGRILKTRLSLDQKVEAGEILLEFDAAELRAEMTAEERHLLSLLPQIEALERELASESKAMQSEKGALAFSVHEAKARQRASQAIAQLKAAEQEQLAVLRKAQVVAELERQRGQADAEQTVAQAQAADLQVRRLDREGSVKRSDRLAQAARLQADIAALKTAQIETEGKIRILEERIALHVVRAPLRGRVAHLISLKPGAVVAAGTRLCTVVPSGKIRAVAHFPVATAGGRLVPGQTARMRLWAFPWTKYGVLQARVDRVGQEPREGLIRVELQLAEGQKTAIPVQHGLAGIVEVEVERIAPFSLVMDAAGRYLMTAATPVPKVQEAP